MHTIGERLPSDSLTMKKKSIWIVYNRGGSRTTGVRVAKLFDYYALQVGPGKIVAASLHFQIHHLSHHLSHCQISE